MLGLPMLVTMFMHMMLTALAIVQEPIGITNLLRGRLPQWVALYVPDCQNDQECCEKIPMNRVWMESFVKEPAGLTDLDIKTGLRMHEDSLLYARSSVWKPSWMELGPQEAVRQRSQRLASAKKGSHNHGVIITLDCLDTRPECDDERCDPRIPQPFTNSREPSLMFLIPHWPNEFKQNGPWWFYCEPGSELVEQEVPIWPWLAFTPGERNARIKRSCIKRIEDEAEIKMEAPSMTIKCLETDPYTLAMLLDARAQRPPSARKGEVASQFLHITLHDLKNLPSNPNIAQPQRTRIPIDDMLPAAATSRLEAQSQPQDTRSVRACLHNMGSEQVELTVTTRRRTLAELFAEDQP